jgi:hypothetical protein
MLRRIVAVAGRMRLVTVPARKYFKYLTYFALRGILARKGLIGA